MEYQAKQGYQEGYQGKLRKAGFERLWIWQEAHQLMLELAQICKSLPREERFLIKDQTERSSSSVSSNIAEGHTTYYFNDKVKGMHVARKEAGETQNHIRKLQGKNYILPMKADELVHRYEKLIIGINNYIKFILDKRESTSRKGARKS